MMKSTLTIGIMAIIFGSGTAYAHGFTHTTTTTESNIIGGVGPDNTAGVGAILKGNVSVTNADGSKVEGTYSCVSMANPSNSKLFDSHMSCDVADDGGTYSLLVGCNNMNAEATAQGCVGGMKGKTGDYRGKRGNFSQYGKDGKSKGSGQWFE